METKKMNQDYENEFLSDLQELEYKTMLEKADNVVLGFVASTTATGAIPIPFADAPMLVAAGRYDGCNQRCIQNGCQ